jgi:choline-sulfatase
VKANVSLVDVMPTLLDLAGIETPPGLSGKSVFPYIENEADDNRGIFSEYHCQGMLNAGFMLKKGDYKYNYYVGYEPELFNVAEDPGELKDLSKDHAFAEIIGDLHRELLEVVADPEAVDRKAKENRSLKGMARAYQ